MKVAPRNAVTCSDPDPRLAAAVSRLLLVGLSLAVVLLLVGVILTVAAPGAPVSRASSFTELPRALGALLSLIHI